MMNVLKYLIHGAFGIYSLGSPPHSVTVTFFRSPSWWSTIRKESGLIVGFPMIFGVLKSPKNIQKVVAVIFFVGSNLPPPSSEEPPNNAPEIQRYQEKPLSSTHLQYLHIRKKCSDSWLEIILSKRKCI